jgi:hypothetical protein
MLPEFAGRASAISQRVNRLARVRCNGAKSNIGGRCDRVTFNFRSAGRAQDRSPGIALGSPIQILRREAVWLTITDD